MVLVESHSSGSHDGRNIHLQPINFLWGKPAPSLLPITQLAQASHQLLLNDTAAAVENLEYGDALGCLRLRKQVSCLLNLFYHYQKSRVDSTNICITAGASFALPTILNVLTDSAITKCIWVVSPCFYMACRMFEDVGFAGKIKAVPERGDGSVDVEALDQAMREVEEVRNATSTQATKSISSYRKTYTHIIYTVPTFSNPSGKVMPLTCREDLVDVARRHDGLIVSDDIYDMLQWSSTPGEEETVLCNYTPPRFVDIDRSKSHSSTDPASFGNALSIGSLSKIVAPGTRIGWVDANAALVNALGQYGSSLAGGGPTSQLVQGVIVELLRNNWLEQHIKFTLVPAYRTRRQLMVQAIEDHLRPLGVVLEGPPSGAIVGGFFLWLRLPASVSSHLVRTICAEQELLALCPGADCRVPEDENVAVWDGFVRLSYSYEEESNLVEGIVRLARAIKVSMK